MAQGRVGEGDAPERREWRVREWGSRERGVESCIAKRSCGMLAGHDIFLEVGGCFLCASASVSMRRPAVSTGPGQSELL